jgi:hypothetical protein
MFLVTAVEDQGHARCDLRRTPYLRTSLNFYSTHSGEEGIVRCTGVFGVASYLRLAWRSLDGKALQKLWARTG